MTDLTYRGSDASVVDYLCSKACTVEVFSWCESGQNRFDFSAATVLTDLGLEITGRSAHLRLPVHGHFEQLRLMKVSAGCKVSVACPEKGRGVCLMVADGPLVTIPGLKKISSLELFGVRNVDVAEVVKAYPNLTELTMSFKSGGLISVTSLTKLRHLKCLRIFECYDLNVPDFPGAAQMPNLQTVYIDGIRAADAKLRAETLRGIEDLTICGRRTDQWIANNLDNPFRHWDEDSGASTGKKVMNAWKTAMTEIGKLPARGSKTKGKAVLNSFVEVFNKLDQRSGLTTDQREQIRDAFFGLAAKLPPGTVTDDDYDSWAKYA
ncbi:MAG: hypothetical protein R3C49_13630 [Planctomycetaceae bacterium]